MNTTLGSIRLALKRDSISLGEIEETAANTFGILDVPPFVSTGTAASTMEIYFEVGIGLNLYVTFDPILLEGVITHKPSISSEVFTSADYVRLYEVTVLPSQYSMRVSWRSARIQRHSPFRNESWLRGKNSGEGGSLCDTDKSSAARSHSHKELFISDVKVPKV